MVHIELNPLCVENILIASAESTSLFNRTTQNIIETMFFPGAQTSVGRNSALLIMPLNIFLYNIKQTGALRREGDYSNGQFSV